MYTIIKITGIILKYIILNRLHFLMQCSKIWRWTNKCCYTIVFHISSMWERSDNFTSLGSCWISFIRLLSNTAFQLYEWEQKNRSVMFLAYMALVSVPSINTKGEIVEIYGTSRPSVKHVGKLFSRSMLWTQMTCHLHESRTCSSLNI